MVLARLKKNTESDFSNNAIARMLVIEKLAIAMVLKLKIFVGII
jgi:ribosomal protein L13